MSYSNSYADLLYEVISGRYQNASTVITTNRGFKQWGEIFPNAACVVTMIDRLTHKAETVLIEGESYRQHEAKLRAEAKEKERRARKTKAPRKEEKEDSMFQLVIHVQCDSCRDLFVFGRVSAYTTDAFLACPRDPRCAVFMAGWQEEAYPGARALAGTSMGNAGGATPQGPDRAHLESRYESLLLAL